MEVNKTNVCMYYFRIARRCIFSIVFLAYCFGIQANNVRILGDVRVSPRQITNPGNVATVTFTVEWDNSWRDMFNYDAVYVFLKYKLNEPGEAWHHLYVMNEGNQLGSADYTLELVNNTSTLNKNEGFFLYRNAANTSWHGTSTVDVTLKWLINSNSDKVLQISDFEEGKVLMMAMGIEMVYVPRGGFRIGDTYSANHFRNNYLSMPEKYDLINPNSDVRTSSPVTPDYPDPLLAANRVNDLSAAKGASGYPSNSWYGDKKGSGDGYQFWAVHFDQPITIKYLAIESVPGYVPKKWEFQGRASDETQNWESLYVGTKDDWETSLTRTYPPTRAFRINTNKKFIEYRVFIKSQEDMENPDNPPLIKNISMTTVDLAEVVDNSVIVNAPTSLMGWQRGLAADDGDTWTGTTDVNYPNGYSAFYVMKYEISQEQYVSFVNRLRPVQQQARTIGAELDKLKEGDYVFGQDRTKPSCRNGIKLMKRPGNGEPLVFEVAGTGTGPTLACNYLSPADMLAYADWTGLRPMSEMEYEKMCRPFYPSEAVRGEYPWNSKTYFPVTGLQNMGDRSEKPALGTDNVNFGQQQTGPVRCGAFAVDAQSRQDMGASFWGTMELAGNLAEIYYNVNTEGRRFRGLAYHLHGDGKLGANGATNMTETNWSNHHNAFCLKGGHWADTDPGVLGISDRTRHWEVYRDMNISRRDSTVGFRLAHTAPQHTFPTYLTLQNGLSTREGVVADTVCHGDTYTIHGNLPEELKDDLYAVAWFVSENQGTSWEPVEGEGDQSLIVTKLWNVHTDEDVVKEYWFKKEIYGLSGDARSENVVLKVLNDTTYLNSHLDTLDVYDHSRGIEVQVSETADFHWIFKGKEQKISHIVRAGKDEVAAPYYKDLNSGDTYYILKSVFRNHCVSIDTIRTYVKPQPVARLSTEVECGDWMIDARDQRRYRTVAITRGEVTQCWMADNLNYYVLNSRCYEDKTENCDIYGRLYNWTQAVGEWTTNTVRGICPEGWHIPNSAEWIVLQNASGEALRSRLNLWQFNNLATLGTNTTRFSALPGGGYFFSYSTQYGSNLLGVRNGYYDLAAKGWWWSSSYTVDTYTTAAAKNNAMAAINIPAYATLDYLNNKTVGTSVGNSLFYGRNEYLGNRSSLDAYSKYYSQTAVENNFYFGVRCVKDE